jgi:hypothetical protein
MPTRARRLLLLILPAGLAALAIVICMLWPRTSITRENASKIQVGMTLAEVEAILGGPARDESTGPCHLDESGINPVDLSNREEPTRLELQRLLIEMRPHTYILWRSDSVVIWATQSQEGQDRQLTQVGYVPLQRSNESLLDRLRRWFSR